MVENSPKILASEEKASTTTTTTTSASTYSTNSDNNDSPVSSKWTHSIGLLYFIVKMN